MTYCKIGRRAAGYGVGPKDYVYKQYLSGFLPSFAAAPQIPLDLRFFRQFFPNNAVFLSRRNVISCYMTPGPGLDQNAAGLLRAALTQGVCKGC